MESDIAPFAIPISAIPVSESWDEKACLTLPAGELVGTPLMVRQEILSGVIDGLGLGARTGPVVETGNNGTEVTCIDCVLGDKNSSTWGWPEGCWKVKL